jgi:predicted acylesterase/phospholipase RssA
MHNIGLVLSGGMAKGAYQIGALKAINEILKPSDITYVSSASVGALNAYTYLTSKLNKGIELWNNINAENNRQWVNTFLRSSFLQDSIKTIVSEKEISNNFYIPLVNFKKRKLLYIDLKNMAEDKLKLHLRASVAMPLYNSGVVINGESFFDGAMVDNIPIYPILKHRIDYIICIYFDSCNYIFENEYLNNKIIKINFADDKIISNSICFRRSSIKYMINEGYSKTKRILDYVFANGLEDLSLIYSRTEDLNSMNKSINLRVTGDVIVNNLNRITKRLVKRKVIV